MVVSAVLHGSKQLSRYDLASSCKWLDDKSVSPSLSMLLAASLKFRYCWHCYEGAVSRNTHTHTEQEAPTSFLMLTCTEPVEMLYDL
jgi:hypothetical protein